jgi:hypothetical protein
LVRIRLKGNVLVCNEFEVNSARVLVARGGRHRGAMRPGAAVSVRTAGTGGVAAGHGLRWPG